MEQCRKERIKSNNNKITLNLDPKENSFYKELLSTQPVTQSWVTAPLARHHASRKRGWHGRVSAENQTLLRCPRQGAALLVLRVNWHAQEKVDFTLTLESIVETWTWQQDISSLLLSLHCCLCRGATFFPNTQIPPKCHPPGLHQTTSLSSISKLWNPFMLWSFASWSLFHFFIRSVCSPPATGTLSTLS